MAEYKNSIMLGITLPKSQDINGQLQTLIKSLNNTKINLDINIANSDVAKQLESLTVLANNFKNSLGGNINLGNVNEVIKQAMSSMEQLNGEILKTNVRAFDDVITVTQNVSTNINEVTKQTKKFQKMGDELKPFGQAVTIVTEDVEKLNSTLNNIQNAKKSLDVLKSNGLINTEAIDKLKSDLNTLYEGINSRKETGLKFNENDIKPYLEQVKQLEVEEQNLIQLQQKEQDLNAKLNNSEFVNNQKNSYSQLSQLLSEEYSIKQKLITAEGEYKAKLEESLITNKLLQTEQNKKISDNNLSNLQKEIELENQRNKLQEQFNISKAKNNDSSINSLTNEINKTISQLDKMKQTFGSKLPNGFIETTEKELNQLLSKLKETDSVNFNNIRNGLNTVKSSMEQANTETKQLVNSLKETNNGGFFSGISNFLGKIGVFYGVQQVVQEITDQFKKAGEYTLDLDKRITNVQIVTGRTKDEAIAVTNQFKELGAQLHTTNAEMMAGSEEMLRAGYSNEDTKKMMEQAVIGAKISGQTTEQVSQQLITMKNAFNMSADSMSHVVDIFSKLDNTSSSSFKEIAEAVSRTAYSATEAKVPLDTLASYITVVSEKTRREASTIGDQFRTMFSRFQNVKLGNVDEDGKSINDVEKAMNRIGLSIRTSKGEFKDFNSALESFISKVKEGNISQVDKLAVINALGGVRQKEALESLVENVDLLKQHEQDLSQATGSAKKAFDQAYGQSLDARIQDLKRSFEGLYEKILSSDSLKWLVSEFANLITVISNLDGKSLAYIATIGTLALALSKLVSINKELMLLTAEGGVVTGLTKFIGLASGMVALENGATGVATAFGVLGTSIKGATASVVAFMATPIGLAITAITTTLGLAVYGFVSYQQHQEELTQKSKDLKLALEGVNSALKNNDTKGASDNLDKIKNEMDEYKKLVDMKKEYQEKLASASESKIVGQGGLTEAENYRNVIKGLDKQLGEHKKVLDDAGVSEDNFIEAQNKLDNTKIIDGIKEQTKAQLENRDGLQQAQTEYNNYISTVQSLYSQYQTLSAQENLSAEDKIKLGNVVNELQGKMSGLNVSIDENGKVHIANSPLIEANIQKLQSEGLTVDNLSAIRITDSKINSQWQVGNSSVTYAEITNRIGMYKAEIKAIQAVIQARIAGASDYSTMSIGKAQSLEANSPEYEKLKEQTEQLHAFENAKRQADALYAGIGSVPYSGGGGAKVPSVSSGDYMPSGGDSGKKKKDYSEEIADLKSDLKIDKYLDFNNAIKQVDNELSLNKTLKDTLKKDSPEYQNALEKDIKSYQDKQKALESLNVEQKKESDQIKNKLASYDFVFDKNGKLIDSQKKLMELQTNINNMGGSTEADKEKKKEYIDWLKEINDDVKQYTELTGDKIPKTTELWNEQANAIAKTKDEMKESLAKFRDKLAGYELEDLKKKVEEDEKKAEKAYKTNKQLLEDRKKIEIDDLESQIKSLEAQKKALEDDADNNEEKLKKLKAERDLWSRETDNVFAKSKIAELDKSIKETETNIKKASLDKQIESLKTQKDTKSNEYDKNIETLENKYNEEKEIQKEKNADELLEEKAYEKADKLLKGNHQKDIIKLMKSYSKSYKDIGTLLGDNFKQGWIEQIQEAKKQYESLLAEMEELSKKASKIKSKKSSSKDYEYSTNSGTNYTDVGGGIISDRPLSPDEIKEISSYDTGGRTPSNLPDEGKLSILHKDEKILNENETRKFDNSMLKLDDVYNFIKSTGSILTNQLSLNGNYSVPTISPISDLNSIANNIINNNKNTDNSNYSSVEMNVSIINQNGAEAVMNEKSLEKMVNKVIQKSATKYGGKGFNNR